MKKIIEEGNMKIEPRAEHMNKVAAAAKEAFYKEAEIERGSYFEFLYQQSKFIRKSWWIIQFALLVMLYISLCNADSEYMVRRSMGVLSPIFAIIIMPEIWKNRSSNSMEIEGAAYYSLRQIYSARMLLFAFVDGLLVAVFSALILWTTSVSFTDMAIQFFLPMIVTCCICFRTFYSRVASSEYASVFFSLIWTGIWTAVIIDESIYDMVSTPAWMGICVAALIYLVYVLRKVMNKCDSYWEVEKAWN